MLRQVEGFRTLRRNRTTDSCVFVGEREVRAIKTLTHVLWSLLNSIPARNVQRPHRHNSVALDLAVAAKPGVYTLMGKEIDDKGDIIIRFECDWIQVVFITPPGWWHSHHNESDEVAWVCPCKTPGCTRIKERWIFDSWTTSWNCINKGRFAGRRLR